MYICTVLWVYRVSVYLKYYIPHKKVTLEESDTKNKVQHLRYSNSGSDKKVVHCLILYHKIMRRYYVKSNEGPN